MLLLLKFLGVVTLATAAELVINATADGLTYDGHGGLSAGASSRLLYDYDEPQRSQILDYMFTPKFAGSMHMVKVEIGGDSQSTDGTEASHMHERDDLNCRRGYEFWLLEEARKRNPDIATYALSWAVPRWVGNDTYYSDDNIYYHIEWLKCTREHAIGNIDFIGIWNERPWGNPDWVKAFRRAMDREGFENTAIIIPDGGYDTKIIQSMDTDKDFEGAVAGIGLHYPCDQPHPEVQLHGKKYWSSEDYSTATNWEGAGCWGRLLNQNFVRMNMTSTISWALLWSVYSGWPYPRSGLMVAATPWSGFYEVNGPLWTMAHTTQFTEIGWVYSTGGSGLLKKGGSYVTLTSPDEKDVTIVLEKLHGKCLRCAGQSTEDELVSIRLAGGRNLSLSYWTTNQTHQFVQQPNLAVVDGLFSVLVRQDSIVTVSTTTGQSHGAHPTPPVDTPFPLPYTDDFDSRPLASFPKYLSDNGGSFEIVQNPLGNGKALGQVVINPAVHNAWGTSPEPVTVMGDGSWSNVSVRVDVLLPKGSRGDMYAGPCLRVDEKYGGGRVQGPELCGVVYANGTWAVGNRATNHMVAKGRLGESVVGRWSLLALVASGTSVTFTVNTVKVAHTTVQAQKGRIALVSSYGRVYFDNLQVFDQ